MISISGTKIQDWTQTHESSLFDPKLKFSLAIFMDIMQVTINGFLGKLMVSSLPFAIL